MSASKRRQAHSRRRSPLAAGVTRRARARLWGRPRPAALRSRSPRRGRAPASWGISCGEGGIPPVLATVRVAALLGTSLADACGTAACCESQSDVGQTVRTLRRRSLPSVGIYRWAVKVLIPPQARRPVVFQAGRCFKICGEGGIRTLRSALAITSSGTRPCEPTP